MRTATRRAYRPAIRSDHGCTSRAPDGGSLLVSGPRRHLPGPADHRPAWLPDDVRLRERDRQSARRAAGRPTPPRELLVERLSSACRDPPVLARLRLARALGAIAASPGLVEAVPPRLRRDR